MHVIKVVRYGFVIRATRRFMLDPDDRNAGVARRGTQCRSSCPPLHLSGGAHAPLYLVFLIKNTYTTYSL
jgi:hypothetical protein